MKSFFKLQPSWRSLWGIECFTTRVGGNSFARRPLPAAATKLFFIACDPTIKKADSMFLWQLFSIISVTVDEAVGTMHILTNGLVALTLTWARITKVRLRCFHTHHNIRLLSSLEATFFAYFLEKRTFENFSTRGKVGYFRHWKVFFPVFVCLFSSTLWHWIFNSRQTGWFLNLW